MEGTIFGIAMYIALFLAIIIGILLFEAFGWWVIAIVGIAYFLITFIYAFLIGV